MTPCKKYRVSLSKYFDNELHPTEKIKFESHLNSCEACSQTLAQLHTMKEMINNLPSLSVSDDFQIILRHKIRKSRINGIYKSIFDILPRWSIAPAIGFSLAITAFFVWQAASDSNGKISSGPREKLIAEMRDNVNNQIYYVIDDNPESVMLSRTDTRPQNGNSNPDSLTNPPGQPYRSRAAHVSF